MKKYRVALSVLKRYRDAAKAHNSYEWLQAIDEIVKESDPAVLISNEVEISAYVVKQALMDPDVGESYKSRLREDFKDPEEYFDFGTSFTIASDPHHSHDKDHFPCFIGHGLMTEEDNGRCLIVDKSLWEVEVRNKLAYTMIKFKKIN